MSIIVGGPQSKVFSDQDAVQFFEQELPARLLRELAKREPLRRLLPLPARDEDVVEVYATETQVPNENVRGGTGSAEASWQIRLLADYRNAKQELDIAKELSSSSYSAFPTFEIVLTIELDIGSGNTITYKARSGAVEMTVDPNIPVEHLLTASGVNYWMVHELDESIDWHLWIILSDALDEKLEAYWGDSARHWRAKDLSNAVSTAEARIENLRHREAELIDQCDSSDSLMSFLAGNIQEAIDVICATKSVAKMSLLGDLRKDLELALSAVPKTLIDDDHWTNK